MFFLYFFSTFIFDAPREIFWIPFLNHPVTWYGVLFALGFLIGFFIERTLFAYHLSKKMTLTHEAKMSANALCDKLLLLVIVGAVIGARLGHVFFYDWPYYFQNPTTIIKIWEGGLASHGGAVGVFLALIIFTLIERKKFPSLTFLANLDAAVIPAAFIGGFIRVGNFINQEVLGSQTQLPWGIVYLHPAQPIGNFALHPVQLYEAFAYFAIFCFLLFLWNKIKRKLGLGLLSGAFFVLVFGFRFLIEFIKLPQSSLDQASAINMGQILSIPFIVFGCVLLGRYFFHKYKVDV